MIDLSIGFASSPHGSFADFLIDPDISLILPSTLATSTPAKHRKSSRISNDDSTPKARQGQGRSAQHEDQAGSSAQIDPPRMDTPQFSQPRPDLPTLEDLLTASAKKKAQARKAARRQNKTNFTSLAAGSSQITAPEAPPSPLPHSEPQTRPVTPDRGAAASLSTPPQSRSPSQRQPQSLASRPPSQDTPTASSRKRKIEMASSFGELGSAQLFSSQYDVESNMEDISRFMSEDVDTIY